MGNLTLALLLQLSSPLPSASPVAPADGAAFAAAVAGREVELTLKDGRIVDGTLLSRAVDGYVVRRARGEVMTVVDAEIVKMRVEMPGPGWNATMLDLEQRLAMLEIGPRPQAKAWSLPADDSPFLGTKDAPITITMFGNLQCPYTARLMPQMYNLLDDRRFKGRIKIVFKHLPLEQHPQARAAAHAAIAARELGGDRAFFAMLDKAFAEQGALDRDHFIRWAMASGLDATAYERALNRIGKRADAVLAADLALSDTVGVPGTPTLYVNGWEAPRRGADDIDALIVEKKLLQ